MAWFLCLVGGGLFAEVYGYWLHRLLHSDTIHFLSRNHMIHHLEVYGPRMKQRPEDNYRFAVAGRPHVAGIGLEWLVPIAVTCVLIWAIFAWVGASLLYCLVFLGTALGYSSFVIWHLHHSMHRRQSWMLRAPLVASWFLRARRRHDIHHVHLRPDGLFFANFGIGFGWMDVVCGTARTRATPVDDAALERAYERYRGVLDGP